MPTKHGIVLQINQHIKDDRLRSNNPLFLHINGRKKQDLLPSSA